MRGKEIKIGLITIPRVSYRYACDYGYRRGEQGAGEAQLEEQKPTGAR